MDAPTLLLLSTTQENIYYHINIALNVDDYFCGNGNLRKKKIKKIRKIKIFDKRRFHRQVYIFNRYLVVPGPTLSHKQGDSLIHSILIVALYFIWS